MLRKSYSEKNRRFCERSVCTWRGREAAVKKKSLVKAIFLISQIAFSMLVPIALGGVIGYFLDRWLGTSFLILLFLLLGIAAGYRNVWQLVKGYTKDAAPDAKETRRTVKRSPAEEEFERWKQERNQKGNDA